MPFIILLFCLSFLAENVSAAAAAEKITNSVSEAVSGELMGKKFYWDAHQNLGSEVTLATEPPTGRKYISARGTKSGLSTLRFNFRAETVDLSACRYMRLRVRMKKVTDFGVSFHAKKDADDGNLLFPSFNQGLGKKDNSQWHEFWISLRNGSLGLIHRQELSKKGLKVEDLKAENFAAVMKYLNRIDFNFYGEEGREVNIDGLYFSSEGPGKEIREKMLGAGIKLSGLQEVLERGRMMLTELPDGTKALETLMDKDIAFDLEITPLAMPKGSEGALILNLYDKRTRGLERLWVDVSVLSGDKYVGLNKFFLNGTEDAKGHFRNAAWRKRVALIDGKFLSDTSGQKINVRVTANTDFSFKGIEFMAVDKVTVDNLLSRWMKHCREFSMRQMETIVNLGLLEDELRQYERGMFYLGKEDNIKEFRGMGAEINAANEHLEKLMDSHYYQSQLYFVEKKPDEYQGLVNEINKTSLILNEKMMKLKTAVEKAAKKNGFGMSRGNKPDDVEALKGKGRPFLDRTVFLMFANSRWGSEGLRDGPGGSILYDVMKSCGIEGRFALANTLEFSLSQRGDDNTNGWSTVPGLWQMHQGLNHSFGSSPKLQELFNKYGEEILAQTPAGPADLDIPMYKKWQVPGNIFHPEYRKYAEEYVYETAKQYSEDPGVIALTTVNEANFWAKSKGFDRLASAGYGKQGEEAWRRYLEKKYGAVSALNKLWGTNYQDFTAVPRPPCSRMKPDREPSGLVYEFETFRKESFSEYIDMLNKSIKSAAPGKLTWAEPWGKFNGEVVHGQDFLKLFSSPHLDIVHTHNNATPFMSAYNHMFKRYLGKIIAEGEFTFVTPENYQDKSSVTIYNAGMRNIWNTIAWDMRGIVFWPTHFYAISSGDYGSYFHDGNYILPVRAAGAARVLKEKANRINDVLFGTEIISGGVAIMQPSTSLILEKMASYPEAVCVNEAEALFDVLYNRGITSFIVPEEYIADGREDLRGFGVLIIPHATYVDERLDERLLKWIESGGTVISVGPYGLYNQYAVRNRKLLDHLLGDIDVKLLDKETAKTTGPTEIHGLPLPAETPLVGWSYGFGHDKKFLQNTKVILNLKSGPGIIETAYGKGRFIMSAFSLGKNLAQTEDTSKNGGGNPGFFLDTVTNGIANKLGSIPVWLAEGKDVALMLRDDGKGNRYLIALNQNSRDYSRCGMEIAGVFGRISDITTGEGVNVPFFVKDGKTLFQALIAPGEGVVFRLESSPAITNSIRGKLRSILQLFR